MEQYKDHFNKRIKPTRDHDTGEYKVDPFRDAQFALSKAVFSEHEREVFFSEAFSDILSDLFTTWLKSEPHAVKEREFLYHTAMALGSVKEKLIRIEQFGNNAKHLVAQEGADKEPEGNFNDE